MERTTKLIIAATGLLVAIGTLVGTVSMTIGKGPSEPVPVMQIVLATPEQYQEFIENHPSVR